MNNNRPRPEVLVIVGVTYLFLTALLGVLFALTGVNPYYLLVFGWFFLFGIDIRTFVLLLLYWMAMRRGRTNWSTWVVPLVMLMLASLLEHTGLMFMPMIGGAINRLSLFSQLWYLSLTIAVPCLISASTFWLLSRTIRVYLIPIDLRAEQMSVARWRFWGWAILGFNASLIVVAAYYLSLMFFVGLLPSVLSTMSTAFLWFGLATIAANGIKKISLSGVICLVVAVVLSLASYPLFLFFSQGRGFVGPNPFMVLSSFIFLSLKWMLCNWIFLKCGYRLTTYDQIESVEPSNEKGLNSGSSETIDNEPPVREWII